MTIKVKYIFKLFFGDNPQRPEILNQGKEKEFAKI